MRIALACFVLGTLALGCSSDESSPGSNGGSTSGGAAGSAGADNGGAAGSSVGGANGGSAGSMGGAGAQGGSAGSHGGSAGMNSGGSAGAAAGGSAGSSGGSSGASAGGSAGAAAGGSAGTSGGAGGSAGAGTGGTAGSGGTPSAFCAAKPTGTRCSRGTQDVLLVGGLTSTNQGQVNVYSRSDGSFVRTLFSGGLLTPNLVFQGPDNCIYVAGFSEVTVWDTDGSFVSEHFIGPPLSIGFFGGKTYVGRSDKIEEFSDLSMTGVTYTSEPGHYIYFHTDGSAWVSQADLGSNRVALLAAGGGSTTDLLTGVDDPMQIAAFGTNQFLVSLAGDSRVAELDSTGSETGSTTTPGLNPVGAQLLDNGALLVSSSNPPDFDGGGTYGVFTATRGGSAVTSVRSMAKSSNVELSCL